MLRFTEQGKVKILDWYYTYGKVHQQPMTLERMELYREFAQENVEEDFGHTYITMPPELTITQCSEIVFLDEGKDYVLS